MLKQKQTGFTIVELLIVIVVIAILAAISVVLYIGVQDRANDAAVQSDISNIAKKAQIFNAEHGHYPSLHAHFESMGLAVSKNAYTHYNNGSTWNLLYCPNRLAAPDKFAIVAYGKSNNNFMYTGDGVLTKYPGGREGSVAACNKAGVPLAGGADRYWFFNNGAWQPYL